MPNKASLTLDIVSVKTRVPPKTRKVPIQWYTVNGLLKYTIEKISDTNFRNVTTRVTVNEAHSVVRTNTDLMHIYLRASQGYNEYCLKSIATGNKGINESILSKTFIPE